MAEYPRPVYYPSAKVILIPRFEEFGVKSALPPAPKKRAPVRKGTGKDNTEALEVKLVDGTYVLAPKGADPNHVGGPQAQKGAADDEVVLIPRSAQLSREGFVKGATLDVELRYQDFPIDPRTIRAAAIEFYLGNVTPDQFQRGVMGEKRGAATDNPTPEALHLVPSEYTYNGQLRSNLRFQGFVDEFETEWDDQEPIVRLRCADNTRLLINQDAPPQLSIDPKLPIHEATARYMANFPQFVGLRVRYEGQNPPKIGDALGKTAYQPKLGPAPKKKGDGSADKMSVWDYLNDAAGAIGLMVRLVGVTIVFQYPRQLMAGSKLERRDDDPYRPRRVQNRIYPRRTFVYGRNVETLAFSKQFGKVSTQNIEIRCFPSDTLIQAGGIEKAYRRWYSGPMVRVATADGRSLTGTPNHPMLTTRGWVPLGQLVEGDDLVCGPIGERVESFRDPHVDHVPTPIGQVFDALALVGTTERRAGRHPDFHGDGMDGDVDVVLVDRELRSRLQSAPAQHGQEDALVLPGHAAPDFEGPGSGELGPASLGGSSLATAASNVGGGGNPLPLGETAPVEAIPGSGLQVADGETPSDEGRSERGVLGAGFLGENVEALSARVATSKLVEVATIPLFEGHVFSLQTESHWFVAEGLVVHNCYNPKRKKVLVARFPLKEDRITDVKPGNASENQWFVIRIRAVENEKILKAIAQSYYESRARAELGVRLTTNNLSSYGGRPEDTDVLDMLPGDNFEVETNREEQVFSSVVRTEDELVKRAAQYLVGLGYNQQFANRYASAFASIGIQSIFKVRKLGVDWTVDEGVSIEIEGINYVTVRADKVLGPDARPEPEPTDAGQSDAVEDTTVEDS